MSDVRVESTADNGHLLFSVDFPNVPTSRRSTSHKDQEVEDMQTRPNESRLIPYWQNGSCKAGEDTGVVSLLLFWGMLELGVGMIAICLPTLRPLFAGWSPESIIRSIRSAIFLRSVHSGGSKGSKGSTGRTSLGRGVKGTHTKVRWAVLFQNLEVKES